MPRVSIIMNCFNGEKYLCEAMDSAIAQTYGDWELVFWDNASTDSSAEIARSYGNKVRYFKSDANTALGEARNRAIASCNGEFVTFLDTDDYWLPEKLSKQIEIMDRSPDTGFLHANFYVRDSINGNKFLAIKRRMPEGYIFRDMLRDYSIGILSVMIRKKVLDAMDALFDVSLSHASDYDLFLRMLYNTKAKYLNEPVAVYRLHSSMHSMKSYDKNQKEIRYVIDKITKTIPGFKAKYVGDIKPVIEKLEYSEIWMSILKGELSGVREKSYILKTFNIRLILLYLSSYLNHGLWMLIWNSWSTLKGNKEAKQVILNELKEEK